MAVRYETVAGNSAKGIDFPGINVDIKVTSDKQVILSDVYRAHLIESQDRINKALRASVQVNEP